MKDYDLLKQKLALIASSAVLSDSVTSALDDACNLLDEYRNEIDKLRRHNISLLGNSMRDAMNKDEIVSNTLKNARIKIENHLNTSYTAEHCPPGSIQYLFYCKGIRDACWAIDAMIKELEGVDQ